jgi:glyoxylase-like metal-dependent hydrolase (beta-lactamase superfamily II)
MKTGTFFTALLLMWGIYSKSEAQVFKNDELTITKIEADTWVIETAENNTMYLVEGTEKALLIDTGNKCDSLEEIIRRITTKPLLVLLTHGHSDHTGNIDAFNEIYLHPADTVLMDKNYPGKIHYMNDGDVFDLGGKMLEVFHTPAHTPGSVVLFDAQTQSCFSGDAFGSGLIWLQLRPTAPMSMYVGTCTRMLKAMDEKNITKLYCGHYPYVKKAFTKSYVSDMQKLAEALINGTAPASKPYDIVVSFGCPNPMITTLGEASIVYDPEFIK